MHFSLELVSRFKSGKGGWSPSSIRKAIARVQAATCPAVRLSKLSEQYRCSRLSSAQQEHYDPRASIKESSLFLAMAMGNGQLEMALKHRPPSAPPLSLASHCSRYFGFFRAFVDRKHNYNATEHARYMEHRRFELGPPGDFAILQFAF